MFMSVGNISDILSQAILVGMIASIICIITSDNTINTNIINNNNNRSSAVESQ